MLTPSSSMANPLFRPMYWCILVFITSLLWGTIDSVPSSVSTIDAPPPPKVEPKPEKNRTFAFDYDRRIFLKNGQPFNIIAGTVHYFRSPAKEWGSILDRMVEVGLNTLHTDIAWNLHELEPGNFTFEDRFDLFKFLELAQKRKLFVTLGLGPYVGGYMDLGGIPYWLMTIERQLKLRSAHPVFVKYMKLWYKQIMPQIVPLLYNAGGHILMLQLENNYGVADPCDAEYTSILRDTIRSYVDPNIILYTSDYLDESAGRCGQIDGTLQTVHFGPEVDVSNNYTAEIFSRMRIPMMNSAFTIGGPDFWAMPWHRAIDEADIEDKFRKMLRVNASVNIHMFHGGTSFGFMAGSTYVSKNELVHTITSFDYDAPINELGASTSKYYIIGKVIREFQSLPELKNATETKFGTAFTRPIEKIKSMFEYLKDRDYINTNQMTNRDPLSFEALSLDYGFVLYEVNITFKPTDPTLLWVGDVSDRGYVFIDHDFRGVLSKAFKINTLSMHIVEGETLSILVESQGRTSTGHRLRNYKGLYKSVWLGDTRIYDWKMTKFPLLPDFIQNIPNNSIAVRNESFAESGAGYFHTASFSNQNGSGILLDMRGWSKGIAFINGFNLGRYWPIAGPQTHLYIPRDLIMTEAPNLITIFELQQSPCVKKSACHIKLTTVVRPEIPIGTTKIPTVTTKTPTVTTKTPTVTTKTPSVTTVSSTVTG